MHQAVYRLREGAADGADALATPTTLSGYVSASYFFSVGQSRDLGKTNEYANLFKLEVVSLTLASAQSLREDTTGYTVGKWFGPNDQHTDETVSLTQANIDLRVPIETGPILKSLAVGLNYELWDHVISRVGYLVTSVDLVNDDKTLTINLIYSF